MRGPNGCAAADHPLAAGAGVAVLRAGGRAADAAVAMAAVMVVVQPHYSHLGGDAFAMVFDAASGGVSALNSSGPAPMSADAAAYRALGQIPGLGPLAVSVPGCVDGWWQLHQRHGRLPWADLFTAAIGYAEEGFAASRGLARAVTVGRQTLSDGGYFQFAFGHVRAGGETVRQPALARTLQRIADGGAEAFYSGPMAASFLATLNEDGAKFTHDDWQPPARWEEPVAGAFAGHMVHTQPAPSQGFVLPLALGLYERLMERSPGIPAPLLQREAVARAFHVRTEVAGDGDFCGFDARRCLSDAYMERLLKVSRLEAPTQPDGDTTYVLAVDSDGNAVSLIQSVFAPWGSGVFDGRTGVLFHNRMTGFTLREGHANELRAGKRPLHTLHSYLVTAPDGSGREFLRMVGGTPGADRQPQSNLQVLDGVLRRGLDVQDAMDEARWSLGPSADGRETVEVEHREPGELGRVFEGAGIAVGRFPAWDGRMGRAYAATVGEDGVAAAADLRGEGQALVY